MSFIREGKFGLFVVFHEYLIFNIFPSDFCLALL